MAYTSNTGRNWSGSATNTTRVLAPVVKPPVPDPVTTTPTRPPTTPVKPPSTISSSASMTPTKPPATTATTAAPQTTPATQSPPSSALQELRDQITGTFGQATTMPTRTPANWQTPQASALEELASRYDQPTNTVPMNPWDKGAQSGGFEYQPKVMPTTPAPVPTEQVQSPVTSSTPGATAPATTPPLPPAVAETPVPAAPDIPALPPDVPGVPIASPTDTYKTNFKDPVTVAALEQLAQQTGGDYFSSGFTGTNPADVLARRTGTDTLMHTTTGPEAPSSLDELTDMKSDTASLPSSTTSALEALSAESNLGRNPLSNMVGGDATANTTINDTAQNALNVPDVGIPTVTTDPVNANWQWQNQFQPNQGRVEEEPTPETPAEPVIPEPDATTEVVNSVAQEAPTIGAPTETPTNQEYQKILAGLDTSVFDQEYQQGLQQLRNQLGTGMTDLSEEMSARGLGSSGQYVQGASELNAAAMTQANQLATAMQKQKIDAKLQELNSIVAMRGSEMDDATKREIANQTSELEQQKINLASQDQEFQQKQQAIDTAQAIAYNLANMGYTDQEANDLIAQALAEVGDGATADQIWQAIINKLAQTTSGTDQSEGGWETQTA